MPHKLDLKINYIRDGRAPIPENEKISKTMSGNRAKGTKPELALRKKLYSKGIRGYRVNHKTLSSHPDLIFSRKKLAVFINGCFWHRCPYCKTPLPRTHTTFWADKFEINKLRDKRNLSELKRANWNTMVVWECRIKKSLAKVVSRIEKRLT